MDRSLLQGLASFFTLKKRKRNVVRRPGHPNIEYRSAPSRTSDDALRYVAYLHHQEIEEEESRRAKAEPLTIQSWAEHMAGEHSEALAMELTNLINASRYAGLRLETKGVNDISSRTEAFEFVLVKDNGLASRAFKADPYPFQEHFQASTDPHVCVFPNLGGNATLVSPKDVSGSQNLHGHLAVFLRKAPDAQIQSAWKTVASTYLEVLSHRSPDPVWFSTAGSGVSWLHFRFDQRPKYYRYDRFRKAVLEERTSPVGCLFSKTEKQSGIK